MVAPRMTVVAGAVTCLTNLPLLRVSTGRKAHQNSAALGVTSWRYMEKWMPVERRVKLWRCTTQIPFKERLTGENVVSIQPLVSLPWCWPLLEHIALPTPSNWAGQGGKPGHLHHHWTLWQTEGWCTCLFTVKAGSGRVNRCHGITWSLFGAVWPTGQGFVGSTSQLYLFPCPILLTSCSLL